MAIDTAEKRQGAAGAGRPYMRTHFPVATPDEEWRMVSGISYAGNSLSAPSGRIMGSLAGPGGLAGKGGLSGIRGGLAG